VECKTGVGANWTPLCDVTPSNKTGVAEDAYEPGDVRFYRVLKLP
jgi:hypothetical protein